MGSGLQTVGAETAGAAEAVRGNHFQPQLEPGSLFGSRVETGNREAGLISARASFLDGPDRKRPLDNGQASDQHAASFPARRHHAGTRNE